MFAGSFKCTAQINKRDDPSVQAQHNTKNWHANEDTCTTAQRQTWLVAIDLSMTITTKKMKSQTMQGLTGTRKREEDLKFKPTNTTLQLLQRQIYTNARSVPSTRGGGLLGHLAVVMNDAEYLARAGVAFIIPLHPGPPPPPLSVLPLSLPSPSESTRKTSPTSHSTTISAPRSRLKS